MTDVDGSMKAFLTAPECERDAVLAHLVDVETRSHGNGTVFDVGRSPSCPGFSIAVGCTGMGNLRPGTLTERALAMYSPSSTVFVGIAGGLKDHLELGDVVAASKTYAVHGGRGQDDGFRARPQSWEVPHVVEQVARRIKPAHWHGLLSDEGRAPAPRAYLAPIASGEVVLDSRTSPPARQIDRHYDDATAVEMASAGFASAAHANRGALIATVRGISDHADGDKERADRQGSREIAAANAAAYALALTAALHVSEGHATESTRPRPELPGIRNTNVAKGRARMGQQIGVVLDGRGR
ncbi:5'-methylthioadenosine/S-adenosylhomocysteine nucleosidase family protein [Saccharothrix violaceirubra]|uniref:Nucleoside phosphorylase n=1 Tax=Saccharothrix violaceirubra TaxID=413306 RepID=A0A7W7T7X2_9PSEU|nr:hypothetical protein [Saccharothrix violaceirubra]MBB4966915.1 nucleoside phosphorylase [Saccharothrix violaceirubra]